MEQCASTASLLASVREQERQFEMLSRALEEERRSCAGTLPRPLPNMQNGRIPCDADIERLTLNEGFINGSHLFSMEPGQVMQETYTVEEDPQELPPVVSVETSEDGTTRRTETTVKKVVKTTHTRTVIPSVSDTLSLDGGGSVTGMGGYTTPMDRVYRQAPGGGVPMEYPTHTVPRNYIYGPPAGYDDYRTGPPSEAYTSLSRGARMDDRYRPVHPDGYRTLDPNYRALSRNQLDPYAAQPQVGRMGSALELSSIQRFVPEPYGLEDDQRSMGYDEPDYGMGPSMHYSTMPHNHQAFNHRPPRRTGSYEGTLDGDMSGPGDMYYWGGGAPLAQDERGSMASLDSTLRKGPGPGGWRQPELPEVIAMLNYRLDPVRSNAAAYLQHLTYKNDKVKSDVRRLKGIPALVSMLDNPKKEVHYAACGALKNISYGKDADNKIAIKNCDGVPALTRLLRKTHDQDLTDTITGTLWNLSSHDAVKMEIVDHALHALSDEVMVLHSGWEQGRNGTGGGEENCKPRHLEWETALTNTAGCLRNVSSERSEARRKLRECTGLVDSLMYIVQSQIDCKDVDNKLIENSVCLLRNLSYQVHREIPGCERYQESVPINQGPAPSSQKGGCFSSRKGKDEWFSKGRKDEDAAADIIDIPKRTTPAKGYELLFQPEVVRIYTSLLKESKNPTVLEASAGAVQNLCAGRWTYGRYIRALLRQEKGLPMMTELLAHGNDRVVRAMSGALRNLAIDARNRDLLSKHALPHLVANLPGGGQSQPVRALSEETVVSVLSTLHEVMGSSLEAAKWLRASQGIERLVLINKDGHRSEREVRGAGLVLQTVWGYKELRRTLEKDGWKKTDFMVNLNPPSNNTRANGGYEDSTLPLIDKGGKGDREMIPMNDMGPDAYSTLDQRGRRNTLDNTLEPADKDAVQGGMYGERQASLPLMDSYDEKLIVCITRRQPPPTYCPC
ncbi:catenin delta-1 isoform X1 [Labrus bergylta]|uniref:Catenin (cadherin-associated protein), delta 1 n=2 Tax=Labrus bergylta TaxID=56723 RepID=A0A3Q3GUS3_9LABR